MPFQQQKFRETILQMLYSFDIGQSDEEDIVILLMKELSITKKSAKTAFERARQIQSKWIEIDPIIAKISQSYDFERIQSIERNVLRLGVYELLYDETIPPKVAISEAIRLTRKFATPESASFVNAILDSIYKINQGQNVDLNIVSQSIDALVHSEEIANEASKNEKPKQEPEE